MRKLSDRRLWCRPGLGVKGEDMKIKDSLGQDRTH